MNNTYYLQKTSNGTNQITLKSKLLENRIIFLEDEINGETVSDVISQIVLLGAEDNAKPVTLIINSPGGSIRDGLVLIDVMKSAPFPVKTVSLGIAASMAGVILAAGTKGYRYITPNSWVMLHQPLISGGLPSSNCSQVEEVAKSLVESKEKINTLLSELTGKSVKQVAQLTDKDSYLKAEEALSHGLVDKIAEGKELFELMTGGMI